MKKAFLCLCALAILIILFLVRPEPKKSIPFSLQAITWSVPCSLEREDDSLQKQEVLLALSQPYSYLGSGGQCYTFVSEDDQYVVKFFKQKAFALPKWIEQFPLPFLVQGIKKKKMQKKQEHKDRVFKAFKLSLKHLPKETQILHVHMEQTSTLNKILTVKDAKGAIHELPMDLLDFVIQRKAELATGRIKGLMKNNQSENAKEAIEKLLALHWTLHQKGFYNRDPNMHSNYGFIGHEAILIDVGRLVRRGSLKQSTLKSTRHFRRYLESHHPNLLVYFDNCVAKILGTKDNGAHEKRL